MIERMVYITDTKKVVLPRGVHLSAGVKSVPNAPYDPEKSTYEITLTARFETEDAARAALSDANEEITEAFDYPVDS